MHACCAHQQQTLSLDWLRRCGPSSSFRVSGLPEENKPRNILEEIVWCAAREAIICQQQQRRWSKPYGHACRWKAKEIENMRNRVPLAALLGATKLAPPVRDFKAAILAKAAQTGAAAVCLDAQCRLHNVFVCLCYRQAWANC